MPRRRPARSCKFASRGRNRRGSCSISEGGGFMAGYRGNVEAIKGLVRETEVHRDVYIDEEVFQLEMEHVFANTWAYVGHDSQVAKPGDYYGTTIGTQPILMVRHTDNTVKVLHN